MISNMYSVVFWNLYNNIFRICKKMICGSMELNLVKHTATSFVLATPSIIGIRAKIVARIDAFALLIFQLTLL